MGFTLHNITEGVDIVAPLVEQSPELKQFGILALIAGSNRKIYFLGIST